MNNTKDFKKQANSIISAKALNSWKNLKVSDEEDNIFPILGVIGAFFDEISAKSVYEFLQKNKDKDVKILINSPGGDVFEGISIYNMLKNHKHAVEVEIIGIAASAASIIAMAGTTIKANESSALMIHNAWAFACGNKGDLKKSMELLDKTDEIIKDIYLTRVNVSKEKLSELMDEESFIFAQEALDYNFIDEIISKKTKEENSPIFAKQKICEYLSKSGVSRSKQRELLAMLKQEKQEVKQNIEPLPKLSLKGF